MKVKITYPVTLTHHGAYKQFNKITLWLEKFINAHWALISSKFKLPEEIELRLRPLPSRSYNGQAFGSTRIELDVSTNSIRRMMETLMHELRHIEQHFTGRMEQRAEGRHMVRYWDGKRYGRLIHPRSDPAGYQNQPWEVDARSVQSKFVEELESVIGPIQDDRNHD